ncbi:conserved hypothetical protein [Histoplasma capsulatum var. duboisii H88]|uniref:Uncharacterized protein n=1 Tax=Ajellomyces capsulatus (strain H88) TaxID=544711 RepID=F0U538_AJEC8|nr:conserved hypothetical protein [Histoplasma capsulatum var. duboisii H88]
MARSGPMEGFEHPMTTHPPRGLTTYRVRAPMIAAAVIALTTQKPERRILAYADYGALSITTSDGSLGLIYYSWVGATYDNQMAQLPFGPIPKWSDGAPLEEVLAMQVARRAGLPVRRVNCYGEHPGRPHAPVSIPMTRILGDELGRVYKTLTNAERDSSLLQLKG